MEKLYFCVFLLVAISLVQDVALAADWPKLSPCGLNEPVDDRYPNNTVILTEDNVNDFCIPIDTPKGEAKGTYYLRPRERFYVDISNVFSGSGDVEVQAVQQADVGVLRNSCIFQTQDNNHYVKFFIDEDAVMALFYLRIGSVKRRLFQFYRTGLNPAGQRPIQTNYTVDQLPIPFLSVLVLGEDNTTVTIFNSAVCKVEGNRYTPVNVESLFFEPVSLGDICSTFNFEEQGLLRAGNLTISQNEDIVDSLFEGSPSIQVVVVPGNCNDSELQDSAELITIVRAATTPSPTMQTSTTPGRTDPTDIPTGNSGLSAGEIAGVVIASIIIGVGFVVAVILAAILAVKRPEWFKNMRRRHNAAPENVELAQPHQLNDDPREEDFDGTKRTFVLNLWPDGDELEELLLDGNPGAIPESTKNNAVLLTALINKDNCQFFYLVRRVSREELRTTNETAWELLRDFNMRPFPSQVLQKFIDVWVFDENKGEGSIPELVPGPILTVNVSLKKWQGNMKGCAQWVRTKARTNCESTDGRFSVSHTPSATESPPRHSSILTSSDQNHTTGRGTEAAEVQTAAAHELHQSPGPHLARYQQPCNQDSPQPPHQQSPQPPAQPPPPYDNNNNDTRPGTEVLKVLKDIRDLVGRTATAAEQNAQNTGVIRDTQQDTLALAEEIHDVVTAPLEDTHETT